MKEEKIKLSKIMAAYFIGHFDDTISGGNIDDRELPVDLRFSVYATDYFYLCSNIITKPISPEESVKDPLNAMYNVEFLYNPITKAFEILVWDLHWNLVRDYIIEDSEGKDILIQACENFCFETRKRTCTEQLDRLIKRELRDRM